jgi:hypothetical protein
MGLNRRDFVAVTMLGGLATVIGGSAKALAATVPERSSRPNQGILAALFFTFDWQAVLTAAAVAVLKNLFSQACANVGRAYGIDSETTTPSGSGGHAVIHVTMRRHPSGLQVDAHMPDGNGGHAFTHSGTAPSHDHPQMHAHVQQIVGKAHAWLTAHNG